MATHIRIREVGPRDGLQNLKKFVATSTKIALIQKLAQAGLDYLEITAFVSSKAIAQLADAAQVAKACQNLGQVRLCALVPNVLGLSQAIDCGLKEIAVFTAPSETFNRNNINATVGESLKRIEAVAKLAHEQELLMRAYVSTAWVCPYEGMIPSKAVLSLAKELLNFGCYEISIGDTIGQAKPPQVKSLFAQLNELAPPQSWAGHFHDTYGLALDNVKAALEEGVTAFDSSIAGLGGCPYAPGALGNLATEALLDLLHQLKLQTPTTSERLIEVLSFVKKAGLKGDPAK